jgi:hypothetical protein
MHIKLRRIRWARHVACMREGWEVYGVLVGKPEGRRPLGRARHRWKDGIRMDLKRDWLECVKRILLVQDWDRWQALVNMTMNLRVLAPRS